MKKTDIWVNALIYSIYMLLSCIIIMFAEILISGVLGTMWVLKPLTLCRIRAVIYTVGVTALLGIMGFREGYRAASFSVGTTIISGALASVAHLIFALFFSFEAFSAGGAKFITQIVKFGNKLNMKSFKNELDLFDPVPFFLALAALYIVAMIVCGKLGAHARRRSRKALTGSESTSEQSPER